MITQWLCIRPYSMAQALVILAVCSTSIFVLADSYLRTLIKTHWKTISFTIIVVVIWRYPFQNTAFYGLEYEDSYVYTVAARANAPRARICAGRGIDCHEHLRGGQFRI